MKALKKKFGRIPRHKSSSNKNFPNEKRVIHISGQLITNEPYVASEDKQNEEK